MMMSPLSGGSLFRNLAVNVREIHKQKESASFRCIMVPTAGDKLPRPHFYGGK